jgi:hypothetical protein
MLVPLDGSPLAERIIGARVDQQAILKWSWQR